MGGRREWGKGTRSWKKGGTLTSLALEGRGGPWSGPFQPYFWAQIVPCLPPTVFPWKAEHKPEPSLCSCLYFPNDKIECYLQYEGTFCI